VTAPRPYTLVAELTYSCPLRCLYCSNPVDFARRRDELTTAQWCQVLSDAAELGVVQLHLSGGEPAVRGDLVDLVRHARACGLYANLITGGTLLDAERLHRLREAGLDHVQLSIQDCDAEAAQLVAGVRVDEHKLAVARMIRRLDLPLTLNVVLHRFNIDRVAQFIELAGELGAQRLELANTQYYAWALVNRRALMPTRPQYEQAEAVTRRELRRYRGVMEIAFVGNDYYSGVAKPCMGGWGRSYLCINPVGEVLPCHAAGVVPGLQFDSVCERPLAEIWRDSPAMNAFRGDDWMREPCRSCPQKAVDYGGCRCQAFLIAGDAALTDPVCRYAPQRAAIDAALAEDPEGAALAYRDARTSHRLTQRGAGTSANGG
jgi:pyrroloquinoline quinone biosynthesis protein E